MDGEWMVNGWLMDGEWMVDDQWLTMIDDGFPARHGATPIAG